MKKILLGSASALAVAVIAFSGPASAACSWNGYNWDCASPQAYNQPYAYQGGYQPYYGYAQPQPYYYGQYPQWDSTRYPGPKAGAGRGY
jgi:hypothetical protein